MRVMTDHECEHCQECRIMAGLTKAGIPRTGIRRFEVGNKATFKITDLGTATREGLEGLKSIGVYLAQLTAGEELASAPKAK